MSEHAIGQAKAWLATIREKVATLENTTGDWHTEARCDIQDQALSVMVRDGWREPTKPAEECPAEFEILLSTGGPACRLTGDLGECGEIEDVHLEWQDWGTPWTEYGEAREHRDALRTFAAQFYLGD